MHKDFFFLKLKQKLKWNKIFLGFSLRVFPCGL